MSEDVMKAISILRESGIVIFPTDTAFAVGCRIDDERTIERLFAIRRRPKAQATPVLVDTVKMAQDYLEPIPKDVIDKLIEPYWPGALTIILPSIVVKVPELVRGGGNTLGVRIPNHPIARAIIRGVGVPILGPSANIHGGKTPYKMEDLDEKLVKEVDFVVKGECPVGMVSTVINCSVVPWRIIRHGAVAIPSVILDSFQDLKEMPNQVRHDKIKVTLFIDTTDNKKIKVGLIIDGKEHTIEKDMDHWKSQIVLPLIDKILKKNKLKLSDINSIKVNIGPGSFTGLRVGLAVTNALGWSLDITVNGKKQIVSPSYSASSIDRFH